MRLRERILLALAALAALLWYAAQLVQLTSPAWGVVKALPVAALAAVAHGRRREVAGAATLAAALATHAAGDLLLEWRFLAGVGAFLAGHLIYLRLFTGAIAREGGAPAGGRVAAVALALTGALAVAFLVPRLDGGSAVAIPVYVVALVAMAAAAQLVPGGRPWLATGAVLFVVSDGLLAAGRFGGLAAVRWLVWPIYLAAQVAILAGWLARRRVDS
ncbi:MAG: lysoplasmalogenase family protein [Thermoanaerobaculia bacterium]